MILLLVVSLVLSGVGTSADVCLEGDFDSQVESFKHEIMLSTEDEDQIHRLLRDVKDTMQQRWPGAEVVPFGSFPTGVALKSSDADCFVKIPNFNTSADVYVLGEAIKLLQQQPDVYSEVRSRQVMGNGLSSLLTFLHKPTDRDVDVVFTKNTIYASLLNEYYFNLNENIKPLVAIIKFWFKLHREKDFHMISYNLYLLTLFYLQQINMVPPVFVLQRKGKHFDGIWDMTFNEIPYASTNTESLYQLLGGFFTYYSEFNFDEYIVSRYAGRPIRKTDFLSLNRVPKVFHLYKENVQDLGVQPLDVNVPLCIPDVFEHNLNTAPLVSREELAAFVSNLKLAAKHFQELPRDVFLKALFTKSQDIGELTESKLNSCINTTVI